MEVQLGNDSFCVSVTTPMTACMKTRGPRFDTLGAVTALRRNGIEFCLREGLVDEFDIHAPSSPPGHDQARPGGLFVKIGVGELIRTDEQPYWFSNPYQVHRLARVTSRKVENRLILRQSLKSETGWGYSYEKTYFVEPGEGRLTVQYELANTGRNPIHTEQYNHNWFRLGPHDGDAGCVIRPRFPVVPDQGDWFIRDGTEIGLLTPLTKPCYFMSPHSSSAVENRLEVHHLRDGQAVVMDGDFDVARFAVYAESGALCPEIFVKIHLDPGQYRSWKRVYTFSDQMEIPSRERAAILAAGRR